MISIGNHVRITEGVKILTHDYAWSVIKTVGGQILGASGGVSIGDNVFIGMDSIIIKGVSIGDNVIIGSGSIVTKNCEANSVYAGNPAKRIMSLEQFVKKREENQLEEARRLAVKYYERFGKKPSKEIFHEYFMLFCNEQEAANNKIFSDKINLCRNRKQSLNYISSHPPKFRNFEEFIRYCFNENVKE